MTYDPIVSALWSQRRRKVMIAYGITVTVIIPVATGDLTITHTLPGGQAVYLPTEGAAIVAKVRNAVAQSGQPLSESFGTWSDIVDALRQGFLDVPPWANYIRIAYDPVVGMMCAELG